MPFTATRDGERVLPHEAESSDALVCPVCDDAMSVVDEHRRRGSFVARHFRHQTNDECRGESIPHLRMKAIAFSKLVTTYPDADVSIEKSVGPRRADVLVEFPEPRSPLGKGIAVEVQHRNNSKDLFATDQDYYDEGFSVLWLSEQHYAEYDVAIDHIQPVWPKALPQLRGHDGLSWPVVDEPSTPEIQVPLPPDYLDHHQPSIRDAFERGQRQRSNRSWTTHQQVWLSKPHQPTNRSLQFAEAPAGGFYLKLSKGKKGQRPEFVHVPLREDDIGRLQHAPDVLNSALEKKQVEGEWQDLDVCWIKAYADPITAWLKVISTPDNGYLLELGKKDANGQSDQVKTAFTPSEKFHYRFRDFFDSLEPYLSKE
ncbi:Competence protein CoiA-like family protein [Natronoarchaeum philippinense]|uniref:Competence protein CoiA-like family protein n=1 Tax=Natronoarchaeum philippinense TaxID=558529 RepID=A0A285N2A7_NATPI|nr:competence protein CoiA family protein [Natronoarchaeum philippinense]SNZ03569.1 Competence protein CoiA-like family protein [Natronoarchaeum philippinense]